MKNGKIAAIAILAIFITVAAGCTKHYVITRHLKESVQPRTNCSIELIADALPVDMAEDDKPTLKNINDFRGAIRNELEKTDIFDFVELGYDSAEYEVRGAVLYFKRGSGIARLILGYGFGNAKFTAELKLVDRSTGKTLFSGNFSHEISSGLESGDEAFRLIAKDFAKVLQLQLEEVEIYKMDELEMDTEPSPIDSLGVGEGA